MIPLGILATSASRASAEAIDPYWDNVVALLHFDGNLADEKGNIWSLAHGAEISGDGPVLGSGSLSVSADHRSCLDMVENKEWMNLLSSSDPFTLEMFVKLGSENDQDEKWFAGLYNYHSNRRSWRFGLVKGNLILQPGNRTNAGSTILSIRTHGLTDDRWHHVSLTRDDNRTYSVFVDGVRLGSARNATRWYKNTVDAMAIAGQCASTAVPLPNGCMGKIGEFRLTYGLNRYPDNFTPPTEPFPNFGPEPTPTQHETQI